MLGANYHKTITLYLSAVFVALITVLGSAGFCEPDYPITSLATTAVRRITKAVANKGLRKVPSTSKLPTTNSTSSGALTGDLSIAAVTGTPPTLPEIAALSTVKEVFWAPGVVDAIGAGSASQNQCSQFFSSNMDGQSGGLGACNLAESVGHPFEIMLQAEKSLCYMRNMPTKDNLIAGGITVVTGRINAGNIGELLKSKRGTKLSKVNAPKVNDQGQAESIFINVPSERENKREGFIYQAELYFCAAGQSSPRGYNLVQIFKRDNKAILKIINANASDPFNGGSNNITVEGTIAKDGRDLTWDQASSKQINVEFVMESNAFKNEFAITADDLIFSKWRGDFIDPFDHQVQDKGYAITNYMATDVLDIRFLQGAFKAQKSFDSNDREFSGATEYRDTYYASAPTNSLVSDVESFDIDSDPFYTDPANVIVDTSAYSCAAVPNIELTMNGENETLRAALDECFNSSFQNMQFCNNDEAVNEALQNFPNSCPMPGGGPPGGGGG